MLFINIFTYLYIFFITFFIVILPVFFCEIIQSHMLYVRCLEGFSRFSSPCFFLGGGGGEDGPI